MTASLAERIESLVTLLGPGVLERRVGAGRSPDGVLHTFSGCAVTSRAEASLRELQGPRGCLRCLKSKQVPRWDLSAPALSAALADLALEAGTRGRVAKAPARGPAAKVLALVDVRSARARRGAWAEELDPEVRAAREAVWEGLEESTALLARGVSQAGLLEELREECGLSGLVLDETVVWLAAADGAAGNTRALKAVLVASSRELGDKVVAEVPMWVAVMLLSVLLSSPRSGGAGPELLVRGRGDLLETALTLWEPGARGEQGTLAGALKVAQALEGLRVGLAA